MKKLLFVCHGNICRSPMAEFCFRDLAKKRGVGDGFLVSSCATSTEEIWNGVGNPVYPPAAAELAAHGISCKGKRAVQLCRADYGKYDYIIGMDAANIRNIHRICGGDPDGKVTKLLGWCGMDKDVADPWYSERFDVAWRDIEKGCAALLDALCEEMEIS